MYICKSNGVAYSPSEQDESAIKSGRPKLCQPGVGNTLTKVESDVLFLDLCGSKIEYKIRVIFWNISNSKHCFFVDVEVTFLSQNSCFSTTTLRS